MAELPEANISIDEQAGAFADGTDLITVFGVVGKNADLTPRLFVSAKALLEQHDYAPGVDYLAQHIDESGKPGLFIGMPAATPGSIGSNDGTGVTGTCVITVAAAASGVMEETDAKIRVITGGTIGENGIVLGLSFDGGRTEKQIRLGTANTYTVPYLGIVLNFAAGTLIVDDEYTFRTNAPMWQASDLTTARQALAAQTKLARSWMVIGDLPSSTLASNIVTEANTYDTTNDRFVYARAAVRDQILGKKSKVAGETLTFATLGDTITRSAGSWIADGFKVGDVVPITGTASNNISITVTNVTATVLTTSTNLIDETVNSNVVTMVASQTRSAYVSAMDAAFASIDGQKRVDLSIGRARMLSPITGWSFRRPSCWRVSTREYQHDVHIPAWRKTDGPLNNCDMTDGNGKIVEFDERVDRGGLAGRFTCLRTWANGPNGAFCAMSLTRAAAGSMLSRTHNMSVANVACTVCQKETENAIGQVLVLKSDGKATEQSLSLIEGRVNSKLQIALLQDNGEGPRASSAVWKANRNDVLNVVGAKLNGKLKLLLNGTLEKIDTVVQVQTGG